MTSKGTNTWLYLGLGAVGLALLGTSAAAVATGDAGGSGDGGQPCNYPPPGQPLPGKTKADLTEKIIAHIFAERPTMPNYLIQQEAAALAGARDMNLPVDLIAAVAWRESRFGSHLDHLERRIANNEAIGPMQVKPRTFQDVNLNAAELLQFDPRNQIQFAVTAGELYLYKLHVHYLPGYSWCDVLQAYNLGPTAFLNGQRNRAYADSIIRKALTWSELRTT
jgi:soluble lytic murein transglycosylase-like protein